MGNDYNDDLYGQEGDGVLDGSYGLDSSDGGEGTDRCLRSEETINCESDDTEAGESAERQTSLLNAFFAALERLKAVTALDPDGG